MRRGLRVCYIVANREHAYPATYTHTHKQIRTYVHSDEKNLAKELVRVFPVDEFAVVSFGTTTARYPTSGGFVDKDTALKMIPSIAHHVGLQKASTGKALKEAAKMFENER